jgi:predicted XRE-type DNA-binding protein
MNADQLQNSIRSIRRIQESNPLDILNNAQEIGAILKDWIKIAGIPHKKLTKALGVKLPRDVHRKLKKANKFSVEQITAIVKICVKHKI